MYFRFWSTWLLLATAVPCRSEFTYRTIDPNGDGGNFGGPDPPTDDFVPLAGGQLSVLSTPVVPSDFLPLLDDREEIELEIPLEILQNFANQIVGPSNAMVAMATQALHAGMVDRWFEGMMKTFDYMERTLSGLDLPGRTSDQALAAAAAGRRLVYPRVVVDAVVNLAELRAKVASRRGTPPAATEALMRHALRGRRTQFEHSPVRSPVRVGALLGAGTAYAAIGRYCDAAEAFNGYLVGTLRKKEENHRECKEEEHGECREKDAAPEEEAILPVPNEEEVRTAATAAVFPQDVRMLYPKVASFCPKHAATAIGLYEEMLLANVINPARLSYSTEECKECWGHLHILRSAAGRKEESEAFFAAELQPKTAWAHPDQLPETFDARLGYRRVDEVWDEYSDPVRRVFFDPRTFPVGQALAQFRHAIAREYSRYERAVSGEDPSDDPPDAAEDNITGDVDQDAFAPSHPFSRLASHYPEGSYDLLDVKDTSDGRKGRNWNVELCTRRFPTTCGSLASFREVHARGVLENGIDAREGCRGLCDAARREEQDGHVFRTDPPAFHRLGRGVGLVPHFGDSNQVVTCRVFVRGTVGKVEMVVGGEVWTLREPHEVVCFDKSYVNELRQGTAEGEESEEEGDSVAERFPLAFLEVNFWNPRLIVETDQAPNTEKKRHKKCVRYHGGTGNPQMDATLGLVHKDEDCLEWDDGTPGPAAGREMAKPQEEEEEPRLNMNQDHDDDDRFQDDDDFSAFDGLEEMLEQQKEAREQKKATQDKVKKKGGTGIPKLDRLMGLI